MKNKILSITIITALLVGSCKQEVIKLEQPAGPTTPPAPSKGTADFTKFVAIGNSLTAGYQASALFNEGQANSLPKILSTQFATVGGGPFNQPDINSVNGFSSNPGIVLGRLILFDPDGPTVFDSKGVPISGTRTAAPFPSGYPGAPAPTCPSAGSATPALKAPYNTADAPTPFTGDKAALNNFAVPGILLGQALTPLTGGPSTANPAYNGLYARFASNPGTSTIMGDAVAANGTFFLFDLGNNDVLGYATTGASGAIPLTSEAAFNGQYTAAINTLLGASTTSKGVIANIPDVTTIPFFRTVLWNAIAFKSTDAATISAVNAGYAPYNAGITNSALGLTAAEITKRTIPAFVVGANPIIITDKTLTNLTSFGLPSVRAATKDDLITLTAGGVLGTCVGGDPTKINGITVGLADNYVLMPTEIVEIQGRTTAFNAIIKGLADGSDRIALADVNATFTALYNAKAGVYNGVTITPSFAPPTGAFSEDGVHPNSRGYAFMANIFIGAINKKFAANIPLVDISKFKGTGLPVNP